MKRILILLPAAAWLALPGCGGRPESRGEVPQRPGPAAVRVQPVQRKALAAIEEVVGTVRAKRRATLEARLSGSIQEMPVILGQTVKAGDLVARLHAPEVQARLEQARANLAQSQKDWNRISALFEQQAVARSDYDAADTKLHMAKAAVAEAEAMASYVEVLAPFSGVIAKKSAEVGDLATPGKPLVDLEDPARLQLEADVPEAIAARIQPNARLPIRLDGFAGNLYGTVSEISSSADAVSRTFRVKLDLPDTAALMPGRFARLEVPLGENDSLFVPGSAVIQRGQLEIAFVVQDQHALLHLVKTGRRVGDEIEILSGLDADDAVVVEGAGQLLDGQPVK